MKLFFEKFNCKINITCIFFFLINIKLHYDIEYIKFSDQQLFNKLLFCFIVNEIKTSKKSLLNTNTGLMKK